MSLSRGRLLGYGIGSVGTGVFSAVPGLLLLGSVTLPLAFAATFAAPNAPLVAVAFVLAASAFACFQVPYVALPAEMSASSAERTRIMVAAFRVARGNRAFFPLLSAFVVQALGCR